MSTETLSYDEISELRATLARMQPTPGETVERLATRGLIEQQRFTSEKLRYEVPWNWHTITEDMRRAWTEWAIHKLAAEAEYKSWLEYVNA